MKLAVVDLESTSLKGDTGFLLAGGVKPLEGKARVISYRETGFGPSRYNIDKHLVAAVREEMERYDGWITWNGLLFDLPLLDDRLMICRESPLEKRFARGLDMMWHAKVGKSTLTSARLDWVAKALKCPYQKTDLDMNTWKEAEAEAIVEALSKFRLGHSSYDYIVKHCEKDLSVTEWVYERLKPRIQTISKR